MTRPIIGHDAILSSTNSRAHHFSANNREPVSIEKRYMRL